MSANNNCQCIKADGKQCTRSVSTKSNHDNKYCWQHQSCSKSVGSKVTIPMKKTPSPPPPLKKPKLDMSFQEKVAMFSEYDNIVIILGASADESMCLNIKHNTVINM
jgi:hypothetical protein